MSAGWSAQYRALRQGCGLWLRSTRSWLVVAGEDRVRFLNGLVTCEIGSLDPGQGAHGFFTDVKGHVLADVVVWAAPDLLWLEVPLRQRDSLATHLEKYIVVDRVEITAGDDRTGLCLTGPETDRFLVDRLADPTSVPLDPWSYGEVRVVGHEARIMVDPRPGGPTWAIWATAAATADLRRALLDGAVTEVGQEALEVLRLEEGMPCFGIDYGPENLPQETGLEDSISYTKGCYLGQEVVARLHYRGQVARRLARLRGTASELPEPGATLRYDGRPAGAVTSAARSPRDGTVLLFAMLQRRALATGTRLDLESGDTMRVID